MNLYAIVLNKLLSPSLFSLASSLLSLLIFPQHFAFTFTHFDLEDNLYLTPSQSALTVIFFSNPLTHFESCHFSCSVVNSFDREIKYPRN